MFLNNDLSKIKSSLSDNVGQKVKLTAKKGRKQVVTREGVIESTYPSIFIIKLDTEGDYMPSERRVSYSYTDVLTRSVELVICSGDAEETAILAHPVPAEDTADPIEELEDLGLDDIDIDLADIG